MVERHCPHKGRACQAYRTRTTVHDTTTGETFAPTPEGDENRRCFQGECKCYRHFQLLTPEGKPGYYSSGWVGEGDNRCYVQNSAVARISDYLSQAVTAEMATIPENPALPKKQDDKRRLMAAKEVIDAKAERLLAKHKIKITYYNGDFGTSTDLFVPTTKREEFRKPFQARDNAKQKIRDFHADLAAQMKAEYGVDLPPFLFDPGYLNAGGEPIWPEAA